MIKSSIIIFLCLTFGYYSVLAQPRVKITFEVLDKVGIPIKNAEISYKLTTESEHLNGFDGVTDIAGIASKRIKSNAEYDFRIKKDDKISFDTTLILLKSRGDQFITINLQDRISTVSGYIYHKNDNGLMAIEGGRIALHGPKEFITYSNQYGYFKIDTDILPNSKIFLIIQKGIEFESIDFDTTLTNNLFFKEVFLKKNRIPPIIISGHISFDPPTVRVKNPITMEISDSEKRKKFFLDIYEIGRFQKEIDLKIGDTIQLSLTDTTHYNFAKNSEQKFKITNTDFSISSLVLRRQKEKIKGNIVRNKQLLLDTISLHPLIKVNSNWERTPVIQALNGEYTIRKGFLKLPEKVKFELVEPTGKFPVKNKYIFWWKDRYENNVNLNIRKNIIINQKKWWISTGLGLAGLGFTLNKRSKFTQFKTNPKDSLLYDRAENARRTANRFFEMAALSIVFNLTTKTHIRKTIRLKEN